MTAADGAGWKLPTPRWIVLDDGEARLALDGDDYTLTIEGLDQWAPDTGTDLPDPLRVRTYPRSAAANERSVFLWPETLQGSPDHVAVPLTDSEGIHQADLLLSPEQARKLTMLIGPLCDADYGSCRHKLAVPVAAVDGGIVAALCPDCDTQLPAEWNTA